MNEPDAATAVARVVVTGGRTHAEWLTKAALREALPDAEVTRTDFHAVYRIEREGGVDELCRTLVRECPETVGHVTGLIRRVETDFEAIRDGAVDVALDRVDAGRTFAFRIHKRGARALERDTPELEAEIGASIGEALQERDGSGPEVDLEDPDVRVVAEVFGPETWIGIWRAEWGTPRAERQRREGAG